MKMHGWLCRGPGDEAVHSTTPLAAAATACGGASDAQRGFLITFPSSGDTDSELESMQWQAAMRSPLRRPIWPAPTRSETSVGISGNSTDTTP